MKIGHREVPITGGFARMFTSGVVECKVLPDSMMKFPGTDTTIPGLTFWNKDKKTFQVRFAQSTVDDFDTAALQFVMKHEIGHIVMGHFNFEDCRGADALVAADISLNYHLREYDDLIDKYGFVNARTWLEKLELEYQGYPLPVLHEILHQKTEDASQSACGGIQGVDSDDIIDIAEATTAALAARGELGEEEKDELGVNPGNTSANRLVHSLAAERPEWAIKVADWARNMVELVKERGRTNKRPSWSYKAYGYHVPTVRPTFTYKPDTVVMLVDTSGSMVTLVQQVGATIAYLAQHNITVRCIAGDTQVLYDEEINSAPNGLPGGGGTDIVPLFNRANDYSPTGIVCFTDGYIPKWPKNPDVPVLWIIDNVEPPYGEFVAAK